MARVQPLHIPHKTWATDRHYPHYQENLRAITRWADHLSCSTGYLFPSSAATPKLHFPYLDAVISDLDGAYLESNYLALERFSSRTCHPLRIPYKQWMRVNPFDIQGREWELVNLGAIERWATTLSSCCSALPSPTSFTLQTKNYDPPVGDFDPGWGTSDAYVLPRDVDFTGTAPPLTRGFRLNTVGDAGGLVTTWQVLLDGDVIVEGDTNPVGELFNFYPISVDASAGQTIQIHALDNGLGGAGNYPAIQAIVFGVISSPTISQLLPFNHGV